MEKLIKDIFAPQPGERVLFLTDKPHGKFSDNKAWQERRKMAREWSDIFQKIGTVVERAEYPATGQHNAPIPAEIIAQARGFNIIMALTEYSASFSLKTVCGEGIRVASMPGVEKRMEKTALSADYAQVKIYAQAVKKFLDKAVGAKIVFSTGDDLYIDLRNRVAEADDGECINPGQFINLPSGEGFKTPYEGEKSQTRGILPVSYKGEVVKYKVAKNKITEVVGEGSQAARMRRFFAENETRRNIAELGIGCNPQAVVTGNVLEDEKAGLHIAYGSSIHLGGEIKSDVHEDIVYAKGCPIEGTSLVLVNFDGAETELISKGVLKYNLLK